MIERIGEKVGHHLFDLKFIGTHIHRLLLLLKQDLRLFLLDQDLRILQHTLGQVHDIETFHEQPVMAGFQLVERQELFHHDVHLGGFIHDDLTVEIPALHVVHDVIFEPFRVTLDQGDGRLQFMGYIIQEFLAHLIDLHLLGDVLLQLCIG